MPFDPTRHPCPQGRWRQQGQALIYGIFVLMGGLAALFFMFNTGQLSVEKTKLVNTADAVAYSAGIMHARALNFDAYTNRALIANEVMIAQLVSMASWSSYTDKHARNVPPLNCFSSFSVPVVLGLVSYEAACLAVTPRMVARGISSMDTGLQAAAREMTAMTEVAKTLLQASQGAMLVSLKGARTRVMQQVADENYAGDGSVRVDSIALADDFFLFGGAPLIELYSGPDRQRFKDVAVEAAYRDSFVKERRWTSRSPWPCIVGHGADFKRRGGTEMIGMDEWKAMDTGSIHPWHFRFSLFSSGCRDDGELPLGYASQAAANGAHGVIGDGDAGYGGSNDNRGAKAMASSMDWDYSGLPKFFELKRAALDYSPSNPDPDKRDVRVTFSIRLTRAKSAMKTSDGASVIKPSGALELYQGSEAHRVLAAVSTSEVFFERPDHPGGPDELASLFNPFWQVRLSSTPAATVAIASALGGPR